MARWEVQRAIFRALDVDNDDRLGLAELLRFAELTGFDGGEEEWSEDFADLCTSHASGNRAGPTEHQFRTMLDDRSDDGLHCTDKELLAVARKLAVAVAPATGSSNPPEEAPPADAGVGCAGGSLGTHEHAQNGVAVSDHDAEDLLRLAWEENEQAGEQLGEGSDDEGVEDMAVGIGASRAEDARPAGGSCSAPAAVAKATPAPRADGEGDAAATEDVDDVLDALLVQAGVSHLAEEPGSAPGDARFHTSEVPTVRKPRKRKANHDVFEEAGGHRDGTRHSTKSGRPGALRGSAAGAGVADDPVVRALRLELLQLGTKEAMHDQQRIPQAAQRIVDVHMPVAGVPKVLQAMAGVLVRQDVLRSHKLAIAYVFHELLISQLGNYEVVEGGAQHFLEAITQSIARLPPDKVAPFLKLLDMWKHVYPEKFLARMRTAWAPRQAASASRPGTELRTSEARPAQVHVKSAARDPFTGSARSRVNGSRHHAR